MTTTVFFLLVLALNAVLVVAGVRHLRSPSNPQTGGPVNANANANANATTLITIELLNPLQLAEQRQGLVARLAGVVAPGPIKRIVHDTVANMIREQLASEGAHADVRIVSQEPLKAELVKPRPVKAERLEAPRVEQRKPHHSKPHHSKSHHSKSHHSKSRSSSSGTRTRPLLDDALVIVPEHATAVLTPALELAGKSVTSTL